VKKLTLLFLLFTSIAFAGEKVTVEADSVDTPEESVFHAKGNVKVFQGGKTLLADEVYYYKDKNFLRAKGNVKLSENGQYIECTELEYNSEDKTALLIDAYGFMPPYHWITASKIDRKSEYRYYLEDATFSTCEGKRPDWSFKASKANVGIGGYLTAWHTRARVKNVPLLYTPYFIYPIKTERETGFLVPSFGFNSKLGAYIQPKFFWNIDVDQDMTFSTVIPSKSSALHGVEHRYTPNSKSSMYTYLEYTGNNKRYPSKVDGEYTIIEEDQRFFLYNKSKIRLTDSLYLNASAETVSDYEYLDDYLRYNLINDYENSIDEYDTEIQLYYTSKYTDAEIIYSDEMEYNVGSSYIKEHVYRSPGLIIQKNITKLPVYFKYLFGFDNVRYTKYQYRYPNNRNYNLEQKYKREHFSLNIYKPVQLYIMTFTPSITLYETRWHDLSEGLNTPSDHRISSFADIESDGDTIRRRTYRQRHTLKLNEIYKNYSNFKHSIYNTLTYTQVPNLNQKNLVDHIYDDNIDWTQEYSYTLSNYIKAKTWSASLKNTQVYDITRDTKRYDEFISDFNFRSKPFSLRVKHEYSKYEKDAEFLYAGTLLRVKPFQLRLAYTFDKSDYGTEDNNTSASFTGLYSSKKYDLSYTVSMSGENEKLSWSDMTEREDRVSVTYKKDCWAFGVSYIRETDPINVDINADKKTEHTIMFTITLRGLGSYQTGLDLKTEGDEDDDEQR